MGPYTAVYKLAMPEGTLELLHKFQTDFREIEPSSNCCRWSRDNQGLAVGGDDKVIRLYKVTSKDFKGEMPLVCELNEGGHTEAINSLDISPGKTLIVSAGNDCTASIFDLATKKCIKKLSFRDKNCKDAKGNPDSSNFLIRGCFFTNCGRFVYLLAAKMRYKSFLVKYEVLINGSVIDFRPISTLEVHTNAVTRMLPSRDDLIISIATSDGFIKVVNESSQSIVLTQKRHNLPVTAMGFLNSSDFASSPNTVVTGSADYLYNIIGIP